MEKNNGFSESTHNVNIILVGNKFTQYTQPQNLGFSSVKIVFFSRFGSQFLDDCMFVRPIGFHRIGKY